MEHFKQHLEEMINGETESAKRDTYMHQAVEPEGPIVDALVRLTELRRIKDLPDEEVIPAAERFLWFMVEDREQRFPEPRTTRLLGHTRLTMNRNLGWTISDMRQGIDAYKVRQTRAADLAAEAANNSTMHYLEVRQSDSWNSINHFFNARMAADF